MLSCAFFFLSCITVGVRLVIQSKNCATPSYVFMKSQLVCKEIRWSLFIFFILISMCALTQPLDQPMDEIQIETSTKMYTPFLIGLN